MNKNNIIIPRHELTLLQSYLFSVYSSSKKCEENFIHTEWFINTKYSQNEINEIVKYLESKV